MNNEKKIKYANVFQDLLKVNSYDKVNVSDICTKCETPRSNFYYHFKSKNALAEWIFAQDFSIMKRSTDNISANQAEFLDKMRERNVFYIKALDRSTSRSLYHCVKKCFIEFICHVNDLNDNDIDEVTRFKLDYMASGWVMTVYTWLKDRVEISSEEFSRLLCEYINGISFKEM